MLCLLLAVVVAVLTVAFATDAKMGAGASGAVLAAQFYCDVPCAEKTGLYVSAVDPASGTPTRLQQLLPPAPVETRQFPLHTVFDPASKLFITFGVDYPTAGRLTAWPALVSGASVDTMKATSMGEAVELTLPVSSSPAPLNFLPLRVARVVLGPQNVPHVVFSNGEVHAVDLATGVFTPVHRLISDAQALDVYAPAATAAQVFDGVEQKLYSVLTAGMYAYLVISDFSQPQAVASSDWIQLNANMNLDPGADAVQTDFSPETFTNALVVRNIPNDSDAAKQLPRLMLTAESLNDVGFDQLVFVNTTTGVMDAGPVYNLMDAGLVFRCQPNSCDLNRVSAYDAASGTVYFQAHMNGADSDTAGNIAFAKLGLSINAATQKLNWYVQVVDDDAPFGYNAFQFYAF